MSIAKWRESCRSVTGLEIVTIWRLSDLLPIRAKIARHVMPGQLRQMRNGSQRGSILRGFLLIAPALPLLLASAAGVLHAEQAGTLYRWIDGDGVPHFADQPPPGGSRQAERLAMPAYTPPELPVDEQPYSILNQLERMETQREKLARERREKRQQDREYLLRKRELELRREGPATTALTGPPVFAYPQPRYWRHPYPWPGPGGRPSPPTGPSGLWQPDHPAYRPYPRAPFATPTSPGRIHVQP
jgi:hypothetical protein